MQNGWDFVWTVVASSAGSAALLAVVAWLGKAQIAHWLNKDIEAIKAQHQRDLESYKTVLIAQAEAMKVSQDVKKSMALNLANMQFDAIRRLHELTTGVGIVFASFVTNSHSLSSEAQLHRVKEFTTQGVEIQHAIRHAAPFIGSDEAVILLNLHNAMFDQLLNLTQHTGVSMPETKAQELSDEMSALQAQVDMVVRKHLGDMLNMV